jgi:hypothetical protein
MAVKFKARGAGNVTTITPASGGCNGGASCALVQGQTALLSSSNNSAYTLDVAEAPITCGTAITCTRTDYGLKLDVCFYKVRYERKVARESVQLGYEQAINSHKHLDDGEANEFGFGPIIELASGKFLLTLNPLFGKQIGTFADQEGLGFQYGWRGEYDFTKHWGLGVEMFGEIEDLSNPGSFNDQNHSIGPTLFWQPGGGGEEAGDVGEDDDNGKSSAGGPAAMEFSMNVGVQFGLTDATSDTALKFQGSLAF